MINVNEIRIGNWFKHNNQWSYRTNKELLFQFEERDWYALGECTLSIENLYPVRITPEILKNAGFEYVEDGEEVYEQKWVISGYDLIWGPDYGGFFYHNFMRGGCLKYVHQLQNLYFALTGEELNINL